MARQISRRDLLTLQLRRGTDETLDPDATPTAVRPVVKPRLTLPSKPVLTEKQWQQQIVDLARYAGYMVYHTFDSRHSEAGYPDLTLVRGDRLLFVECKAARGKLSIAQVSWLNALAYAGVEVYVWYPDQWNEVQRVLLAEARQASA